MHVDVYLCYARVLIYLSVCLLACFFQCRVGHQSLVHACMHACPVQAAHTSLNTHPSTPAPAHTSDVPALLAVVGSTDQARACGHCCICLSPSAVVHRLWGVMGVRLRPLSPTSTASSSASSSASLTHCEAQGPRGYEAQAAPSDAGDASECACCLLALSNRVSYQVSDLGLCSLLALLDSGNNCGGPSSIMMAPVLASDTIPPYSYKCAMRGHKGVKSVSPSMQPCRMAHASWQGVCASQLRKPRWGRP